MNRSKAIYLDNAAGAPPAPEVISFAGDLLQRDFGNPSSVHAHGQRLRHIVDVARAEVAALIGASPEEIVFTSGGTESCNLALRGFAAACGRPVRLALSAVEHDAVHRTAASMALLDRAVVSIINVDKHGVLDPAHLRRVAEDGIDLLSVITANNETGVCQPMAQISEFAVAASITLHTDAVQALGTMPLDVRTSGVDLMSLSAHKIGGLPGAGALFIRRGTRVGEMITGGPQENHRRAGTENYPAIAAFGRACRLLWATMKTDAVRVEKMRTVLESTLTEIDGVCIHGVGAPRLPGIVCASVAGIPGETLVMAMDLSGVSISNGSACHALERVPSRTLAAMRVSPPEARTMIRVSIGRHNTEEEIHAAAAVLKETVLRLRRRESLR
jgi:cysteine desulfurase